MTGTIKILILYLLILFFPAKKTFSQTDSIKVSHNLLISAYNNNLDSVIYFLKQGAKLSYTDEYGQTAVFYAVQNNNMDMLKLLEFNGSDINKKNYDGMTPLGLAVWLGFFDIAEYLCYKGAKPNISDIYGTIPLHYAAYQGDFYMCDMLLFYHSQVNNRTYDKDIPLHLAAINGDTAVISLLLRHKADVTARNSSDYTPLDIAVMYDNIDAVKLLINAGDSVADYAGEKLLRFALRNNADTTALWLISSGEYNPVNKNNKRNPYNIAVAMDNRRMADVLKSNGFNSGWFPYFSKIGFTTAFSFNKDDFFTDFTFLFIDTKYNLGIDIDFGTRFKRRPIIMPAQGNVYYQFYERRNYFSTGLIKYFNVSHSEKNIIKPFAGIDFQFHFGNYSGSDINLKKTFAIVPRAGVSLNFEPLNFEFSYCYRNYDLSGFSHNFFSVGAGFTVNLIEQPKIYFPEWL